MRHNTTLQKIFLTLLLALHLSFPCMAQSPYIVAVDEYVPAPGQFINTLPAYDEGDDAFSMAEKCTEAIADNAGGMVCLGAWGGYITFHFDHPIINVADCRDLRILGNAYEGNSEPGIIMVSQDENNNGLPDDRWYEISGSADIDSIGRVWYDYEVDYSIGEAEEIVWTDNRGNTGTIQRNSFHTQPYFPQWLSVPLSFHGTRLPDNAYDKSGKGSYWIHETLRYGYADNVSNNDTEGCSIDLSWAVDPITREPVHLTHADFIRVYSGCLQCCGWIGETSTEICGATDLHPQATLDDAAIIQVYIDRQQTVCYDLLGRRIEQSYNHQNKLNIIH